MKNVQKIGIVLVVLFFLQFIVQPVLAEEQIVLDFFYSKGCHSCEEKLEEFQPLEQDERYRDAVVFNWKDYVGDESAKQEYETKYLPGFQENASIPLTFVVIKNETDQTLIQKNVTVENVLSILDTYLDGAETTDDDESNGTPGFELLLVVAAIALFLLWNRKRVR